MADTFIMTAHVESASDMIELQNIRNVVKMVNKQSPQKFYVKCQGRGPRVAAALKDGKYPRAYDSSLPLRHATHMDVYLYKRRS